MSLDDRASGWLRKTTATPVSSLFKALNWERHASHNSIIAVPGTLLVRCSRDKERRAFCTQPLVGACAWPQRLLPCTLAFASLSLCGLA